MVDPLLCPRCGTEITKLSAIKDPVITTKILRHLYLREEPPARGPPHDGAVYESCCDDPLAAAELCDPASIMDEQAIPTPHRMMLGLFYDAFCQALRFTSRATI